MGLVQGSWDLFHIGHLRYLQLAREQCEYLIVGVDSDKKIRQRKGWSRPIIPYEERAEFIRLLGIADEIRKKSADERKWALIKEVRPSVLIATEGNYTAEEIQELEANWCGEVYVAPRQATTSTSNRIREVLIKNNAALHQARSPDNVASVYALAQVGERRYEGRNLIDNMLAPEEIANRTELFYATVEHAEINCLKQFKECPDKFMVTLVPCKQCLKAIADRGVKEIFYAMDSPRNWAKESKRYAEEHGIKLTRMTFDEFEAAWF